MTLDPITGEVYYAIGGQWDDTKFNTYDYPGSPTPTPDFGAVLSTGSQNPSITNYEGAPDMEAPGGLAGSGQVIGLTNDGAGNFWATTVDRYGVYRLYSTVPEPGSFAALGAGLLGFAGLIRRKK